MGLFSNPLGHAGYPPDASAPANVVNSTVRAATAAEAAAGTLDNVYISPLTAQSSVVLDFASPPPMGSTAPNTGAFTTLSATSVTVTAASVAGASPVVNNGKSGQASFTDVIANGAYGTLTMTNSTVTASSVIVALASCTTVNSAVQIAGVVPGAGTVAFRLFNAGSASTAANININYWVMN